jgi:hypothetical protein
MNAPHADTVTRQIAFVRDPISDEDVARANHYALISRLFHAAPDAALLDTLAESGDWPVDDDAPAAEAVLMSRAWNALCAASEAMDADAAQTEFDALFGGVGRPLITVFGSFHIAGFVNEKPLARLRDDLAGAGSSARRRRIATGRPHRRAGRRDAHAADRHDTRRRRACRTAGPLFRDAHRALVRVPVR